MNSGEESALLVANTVTSVLSFVGEIFMIFTYLKFPQLQTQALALVNSLVISDLIYTCSNFMADLNQSEEPICLTEGFLRQIGACSAAMWTIVIAYHAYQQVSLKDRIYVISINKSRMYIVLISLALATIPLFGNLTQLYPGYGGVFSWCSIQNPYMLGSLFYSIIVIAGGVSLYFYCRLYRFVRRKISSLYANEIRSLFIYPLILFLCWTPAIVDLLYTQITNTENFYIRMTHTIFSHLQGFFNAFAYGVIERVKIFTQRLEKDQEIYTEIESPPPNRTSVDSTDNENAEFRSLSKALLE